MKEVQYIRRLTGKAATNTAFGGKGRKRPWLTDRAAAGPSNGSIADNIVIEAKDIEVGKVIDAGRPHRWD